MRPRIRIGAVNYLNTKPLIHRLEELAPTALLALDLPSRLADQLAAGHLDVALIPVIEYFRGHDYTLVPGLAIASRGPVLSVTLFSRKPWPEIQSLALDVGSRTSSALCQVILAQRYHARPAVRELPLDRDPETLDTDAVLLIGDRAMKACLPGFRYAYDLGDEWFSWTGLPFVFAVWAVRPGIDLGMVEPALRAARDSGLEHVGGIAQAESARLGLDAGFCRRYLETVIRFDLGPSELAGMQRFYEASAAQGLVARGRSTRFYQPARPVPVGGGCE